MFIGTKGIHILTDHPAEAEGKRRQQHHGNGGEPACQLTKYFLPVCLSAEYLLDHRPDQNRRKDQCLRLDQHTGSEYEIGRYPLFLHTEITGQEHQQGKYTICLPPDRGIQYYHRIQYIHKGQEQRRWF